MLELKEELFLIKIGRNDPCPCGSGHKYKKCCLEKDRADAMPALRLAFNREAAAASAQAGQREEAPTEAPGLKLSPAPSAPPAKLTLAGLRKLASRDLEWAQPAHLALAQTLIERMKGEYDKELIQEALLLWNAYSRQVRPVIKKEGTYCAAIEYFLSEQYGLSVPLSGLADKYEVASATISRRCKELAAYAEEYGLPDGLPAPEDFGLIGDSSRDQAQILVYRAMETAGSRQRVQLARRALELYPDSADAYQILAEEAGSEAEARSLLQQGMEAGRRDLGWSFFEQHKGHFWGLFETRPYMRVTRSYAESCWLGGDADEAAGTLAHLLELNPADHTGARYLLLAAYLYTGKLEEAQRVLKRYGGEDSSASFAYDRMILEYKQSGVTSRLKMLYRVARGVNRHVPDYLLGVKRLPPVLPDYTTPGEASEASEYVIMHSRLWASVPELLKWMLKQAE